MNSNDNDLVGGGPYTFAVDASYSPNSVSSDPDLSFNLILDSACVDDYITLTEEVNDFDYYIFRSGSVSKTVQFTHAKKNCPYSISFI